MNAHELGFMQGKQAGANEGWMDGFRLGRSEKFLRELPPDPCWRREINVLYVSSGIGYPYPPIDQAITEALSGLVGQLIIAGPGDPVSSIAAANNIDLMIVLNGVVLPPEQVMNVRNQGIVTAVWFTDDPYYTDWTIDIAPRYDYIFTLEKTCVELYRSLGCRHVFHLPFAVNPAIFHAQNVTIEYRSDICFIGTAYWNRVQMIEKLSEYLANKRTMIAGSWWDRLNPSAAALLKDSIRSEEWLSPETTAAYYNGAKIVINLHRASDDRTINFNGIQIGAVSVNPRSFEINACHTLQVMDMREDVSEHYRPNQEVLCYKSDNELLELLEYYLNHEEERREIAFKGYKRTMLNHTYRHRVHQMLEHALTSIPAGNV
jgi:spore maturation protein CgeB